MSELVGGASERTSGKLRRGRSPPQGKWSWLILFWFWYDSYPKKLNIKSTFTL